MTIFEMQIPSKPTPTPAPAGAAPATAVKARVLVADDHDVVAEGVRGVLDRIGCEVVGVAPDGRALLSAAAELRPDLIVVDISMPVLNGIEAARQLRTHDRRVKIIFLSMHLDTAYVREAFRVGANGYVLKSAAVAELGKAVEDVMQGRFYLTPRLNVPSLQQLLSGPPSKSFGNELTERQREVLQLVAEGKSGKEIADTLHISVKTVEFHKSNLMNALGLRTTAELTRYAIEHKIVA